MAKETPKIPKPKNAVCDGCLKWDQFQKTCNVFWEDKKECTQRVTNREEWDLQNRTLI